LAAALIEGLEAMTTNISGSAKIYAFPARGRFAASNQPEDSKQPANAPLPHGITIASGSGWYHDEAIQEEIRAEPRRKN
jgi:Protein of unknown function (DUF2735)